MDAYKDVNTKIEQGTEEVPKKVKRGVKQGNPLSPFIFNAVTEPFLLQLEEAKGYQVNDDVQVSSLAFADDLMLVAKETSQAEGLLRKTENYLDGLGMKISENKCTAVGIRATKDSWYLQDTNNLQYTNSYKWQRRTPTYDIWVVRFHSGSG
jgi:hypothetical protein